MASQRKHQAAPSRSFTAAFEKQQDEWLRDPARAAEYLMHALSDGDEMGFRLAWPMWSGRAV